MRDVRAPEDSVPRVSESGESGPPGVNGPESVDAGGGVARLLGDMPPPAPPSASPGSCNAGADWLLGIPSSTRRRPPPDEEPAPHPTGIQGTKAWPPPAGADALLVPPPKLALLPLG